MSFAMAENPITDPEEVLILSACCQAGLTTARCDLKPEQIAAALAAYDPTKPLSPIGAPHANSGRRRPDRIAVRPACPQCGGSKLSSQGVRNGVRQWRCRGCWERFSVAV